MTSDSTSTSTSARGKILVIDDEPAVGRVVIRALERAHDIIAVTSGREALDRIAAGERFDVILCDVRMPDLTGLDVHARLVIAAPDQANRMIFMTGDGLPGASWAALDRLRLPILEKPFPLQLLRLLVAKHVGARSE
jgi:CheY-like chemotaxis protein